MNIDNIPPPILSSHVMLMGNKYDLLEFQESENRKWMSKILRTMAHSCCAGLFYLSC